MANPPVVFPSNALNRMARDVGRAPDHLQPLAQTLISHGGGSQATLDGRAGEVALSLRDYSTPIYQFSDAMWATDAARRASGWWPTWNFPATFAIDAGSNGNVPLGAVIPVRYPAGGRPLDASTTNLVPGTGNDAILLVEDRVTGRCWNYWEFHLNDLNAINFPNIAAGLADPSKRPGICNAGSSLTHPYDLTSITTGSRGMGIDKRALITTLEEIASGVVAHAAELTITNTWYINGSVNNAVVGVDYLYPAVRCEWDQARAVSRPGYTADKTKLVPEGLRVAFDVTYAEGRDYVYSKIPADQPRMREFWVIVTGQWRIYGFVVAETGGYGMRTEFDGMMGPARAGYESYGFSLGSIVAQESLMKDFMNDWRSRAYVVNPVNVIAAGRPPKPVPPPVQPPTPPGQTPPPPPPPVVPPGPVLRMGTPCQS